MVKIDLLYQLAQQIRLLTLFAEQSSSPIEALPTSADLARLFGTNHEVLKKQLSQLKNWHLIQAVGFNPKRFRFDQFRYQRLLNETLDDESLRMLLDKLNSEISSQ